MNSGQVMALVFSCISVIFVSFGAYIIGQEHARQGYRENTTASFYEVCTLYGGSITKVTDRGFITKLYCNMSIPYKDINRNSRIELDYTNKMLITVVKGG